MLTKSEKEILHFIQADIPLEVAPYKKIAASLGIEEQALVKKIKDLKQKGYIRRFGAILNHRKVGFKVNCMCVWDVPEEKIKSMAQACNKEPMISHCYLRKKQRGWPYNFYTMIHARSKADSTKIVEFISRKSCVKKYKMLFTQREFKKVSFQYGI